MAKFFGFLLLMGGVSGFGTIGYYAYGDYQFTQKAERITGYVIDIVTTYSVDDEGKSSSGDFPVFGYTYRGVESTHQSDINFGADNYTKGDTVNLFIDPVNPNHILVDTFTERWGGYLLFSLFAAMVTVMGFVMIRIF